MDGGLIVLEPFSFSIFSSLKKRPGDGPFLVSIFYCFIVLSPP